MNVYLYQNNTEKILKNDYIGEYIEETYTIASFSDSTSSWTAKSVSIYKSWYKITKIQIEWWWNIASNWWTFPWIQDKVSSPNNYFIFQLNPPRESASRLTSKLNWQSQSPISFNFTATTYIYKILFTINKIEITINNTTYRWDNSTNMQSIITAIFNWQSPCWRQWAYQWTANDTTFTVTYEKI